MGYLITEEHEKAFEDKNIEFDGIGKLISKPLKEKLKYDAQRLNYMKATSRGMLKL